MNNHDIIFTLPEGYTHEVYCDKDNFYKREYVYNFEFYVQIQNNEYPINNIIVYKNGEVYKDVDVYQESNGFYTIKDKNIVKKGNFNYAVEVILNTGKIYKNDFYLKILNNYIENDIKIVSLSTYGLHENYSYLDIILRLETQYNIDSILIYYHLCPLSHISPKSYNKNVEYGSNSLIRHGYEAPTEWSLLGEMEVHNHQYRYRDLLFDTTMAESRVILYKVKIVTSNGLKSEKIISTMIKPNTLSLNTIAYSNTDSSTYNIYGGIVGRINNKNSMFDKDIFELVIDNRDGNKYLTIDLIHEDKKYHFQTENYSIDYLKTYNKNQTNKSPNIFDINGEGIIKYIVDENTTKRDEGRFSLRLICGDDYFCTFNIQAHDDYELTLKTNKTANNIIRYSDKGNTKYLDAVYEDKTISSNATTGFMVYNKEDALNPFSLYDLDMKNKHILIEKSQEYFDKAQYIMYNDKSFYFINFDEYGIHVVKYDGINYDTMDYKTTLYNPTLEYLKHNMCMGFDTNNNLRIRFINYDNLNALEKISIEDSTLTVIDCSDMIANIFNEIRTNMLKYIDDIGYVTSNNVKYYITAESEYEVLEHDFASMNEDNFVRKFTMQEFHYAIKITLNVEFKNEESNTKVHFNTSMTILTTASVCMYDNNFNIEVQRYEYDIKSDNLTYTYKDTIKNQNPMNIMELMNDRYYLKFEKSMSSKNKDDYGIYRICNIYNKTILLYKLSTEDVYGVGTTNKEFRYSDLCHAKIVSIDYKTAYILNYYNDELIVSKLDLANLKRISQYKFKTNMIFDALYEYTDEQLLNFESLLSNSYKYDSVARTMNILSTSDYPQLYIGGIDKRKVKMKEIGSINGEIDKDAHGFMLEYNYNYPLNLKNRSTYLLDISINKTI